MSDEENEWFCDHCGEYFPAKSWTDVCPCGAQVDRDLGIARMSDGHHWRGAWEEGRDTPSSECEICLLQKLAAEG